jgi:hypothetical protein
MVVILLTLDTLALRYQMDLVPWLAAFAVGGCLGTENPQRAGVRRWALVGMGLLVVGSNASTQIAMLFDKAYRPSAPLPARVEAHRLLGEGEGNLLFPVGKMERPQRDATAP